MGATDTARAYMDGRSKNLLRIQQFQEQAAASYVHQGVQSVYFMKMNLRNVGVVRQAFRIANQCVYRFSMSFYRIRELQLVNLGKHFGIAGVQMAHMLMFFCCGWMRMFVFSAMRDILSWRFFFS